MMNEKMTEGEQAFWAWWEKMKDQKDNYNLRMAFDAGYEAGKESLMSWNLFTYVCSRCDALYEITVKTETMQTPTCCALETIWISKINASVNL